MDIHLYANLSAWYFVATNTHIVLYTLLAFTINLMVNVRATESSGQLYNAGHDHI